MLTLLCVFVKCVCLMAFSTAHELGKGVNCKEVSFFLVGEAVLKPQLVERSQLCLYTVRPCPKRGMLTQGGLPGGILWHLSLHVIACFVEPTASSGMLMGHLGWDCGLTVGSKDG